MSDFTELAVGKRLVWLALGNRWNPHYRMTSFLYEWSILGVGRRGGVVRPARDWACNYR